MREPELLDANIRTHLEAENTYTGAMLAPTDALQAALFEELRGRIKEDDSSVPAADGPFAYYHRFAPGGQHPMHCRRQRDGTGPETVLLDGDREAEGRAYFRLGGVEHSPDHRLLAYGCDVTGSEYYTLRVRYLATGDLLPDVLADARGDIVWAADSNTLFYTVLDDHHRPWRVLRHRLGDDPSAARVVYEESDPGFFVGLGLSESRRFIVITAHDHTTTEVRVVEAAAPETPARLIAPRERGVQYEVHHHGDRFVIRTNADGAEDFKIVTAAVDAPQRHRWRDLVPHVQGRLIRALLVFAARLVRLDQVDGLPRIVVGDLAGGGEFAIAFDEEAYDLGLVPGYEFDADILRFSYSSPTTPLRIYDFDMTTRARTLRKEQEVPSGHDPASYVARRLHAPSHDGVPVPVTVLHARTTPIDGSAPLLLYGYGAYGAAMPASFSTNRLSLVDRGFVYAIAHVRGGTERGYRWYLDGKLEHKPNSFHDFIAAAEHLASGGYTAPGNIVAHGGSAGGLLVGAVANMRPDLFRAVVGEVPFVDVLNTMCDASLPLTPPEWPEWGNPIEDAEAYRRILGYSPYDNVAARPYPHILATAGLADPRVTYWESAKWVARLRALKTDDNMVLLKTNMAAGHAGAAGRFDRLKEVALVYAFVLMVSGRISPGGTGG